MARSRKETKSAHWGVRILIVIIVGVLLGVSMLFEARINAALGLTKINETAYSGETASSVVETESVGDLNVHFLDVGQGDACVVELPDSRTMLIDGGDDGEHEKIIEYISDNILVDGKTIEYFDYAILTHTDRDHCGSMDEVLLEFPAKTFYRPNVLCNYKDYVDPGANSLYGGYTSKKTRAYKNVLEAAYAYEQVEVLVNSWDLGAIEPEGVEETDPNYYSVNFYSPLSASYTDWNNYSPIVIIDYQGERIALSGDCEKEGEAEFVERATAREGKYSIFTDTYFVSAIKLGHHGSETSSSEAYLNALSTTESAPNTLLIISCGLDNKYKHPHTAVLDRVEQMGFNKENILRTDQNGTIVISLRFDTETNEMRMYYGANPMVKTQEKSVDWRYIAMSIFVVVLLVFLVEPILNSAKRKAKRAAKKSGR